MKAKKWEHQRTVFSTSGSLPGRKKYVKIPKYVKIHRGVDIKINLPNVELALKVLKKNKIEQKLLALCKIHRQVSIPRCKIHHRVAVLWCIIHRWIDFLSNILANFRKKSKSSKGTSYGTRRSYLMKKNNTHKSCDTVPLSKLVCIFYECFVISLMFFVLSALQNSPNRSKKNSVGLIEFKKTTQLCNEGWAFICMYTQYMLISMGYQLYR